MLSDWTLFYYKNNAIETQHNIEIKEHFGKFRDLISIILIYM